jgi:hypothetical protein
MDRAQASERPSARHQWWLVTSISIARPSISPHTSRRQVHVADRDLRARSCRQPPARAGADPIAAGDDRDLALEPAAQETNLCVEMPLPPGPVPAPVQMPVDRASIRT